MFPRPVSMKDNEAILALVTRLEELKLIEVVSNADGSQTIKALSKNLGRKFLVATDGQVYLLTDIKNYLATATDTDIQAQTIAFPHVATLDIGGTKLCIHEKDLPDISLAELKASPAKLKNAKFLFQFTNLLSTLNLRNYSSMPIALNSIADLQQAIAILGNRKLDSSISQVLKNISDALTYAHASRLRDTDGKFIDETNIQNLDENALLNFASIMITIDNELLTPNTLDTDTWLCTIAAKLKLKSLLIAKLEQTTDVDFRKALQQEINHINQNINDFKTLLKNSISSLKLISKTLKLAEQKYQAHVLKYPNFEAALEAKHQSALKPRVITRRDKALNALGITAKVLVGLLLLGTIIGLAVASAVFLIAALTVNPVGLAVLGGFAAAGILIADFALTFNALNIMRAFSDRLANLGEYINKKLTPKQDPSLSNEAMNTYADSRSKSMAEEIRKNDQDINKLQTALAEITTLEATYNANAKKEFKQRIKGNTVPTSKMAGTLFSTAPVKPAEQAAATSGLRRNSR